MCFWDDPAENKEVAGKKMERRKQEPDPWAVEFWQEIEQWSTWILLNKLLNFDMLSFDRQSNMSGP